MVTGTKSVERIVGERLVDVRIERHDRRRNLQDRQAVRIGALDEFGGDASAGADLALDQHVGGVASAQPLGERTRHQVAHAAGRKARDDEGIAGDLRRGAVYAAQSGQASAAAAPAVIKRRRFNIGRPRASWGMSPARPPSSAESSRAARSVAEGHTRPRRLFTSPRWGEVGAKRRVRGRHARSFPSPPALSPMGSDTVHDRRN